MITSSIGIHAQLQFLWIFQILKQKCSSTFINCLNFCLTRKNAVPVIKKWWIFKILPLCFSVLFSSVWVFFLLLTLIWPSQRMLMFVHIITFLLFYEKIAPRSLTTKTDEIQNQTWNELNYWVLIKDFVRSFRD